MLPDDEEEEDEEEELSPEQKRQEDWEVWGDWQYDEDKIRESERAER
jgi:hypothetical protein